MPGVVEGLDRLWIFVHPVAHHKEGGLDLEAVQNVNELLGVLIAPCCVEADGYQFLVPLDAVNGQLPCGRRGVHSGGIVDHIEHQYSRDPTDRKGYGVPADQKCSHKDRPPAISLFPVYVGGPAVMSRRISSIL
jgi:hypothetical protein